MTKTTLPLRRYKMMKKMTDQQVANFHKRNVYIYILKNGKQLSSFFEYQPGDLYGGSKEKEIEKLLRTFKPEEVKK